jgi:hypothetical protein
VIDGTGGTARDGIVAFTYTNRTGTLKLLTTHGNLHFYHGRSCAGLINNGDPATVKAHAHGEPETDDHQPVMPLPGLLIPRQSLPAAARVVPRLGAGPYAPGRAVR